MDDYGFQPMPDEFPKKKKHGYPQYASPWVRVIAYYLDSFFLMVPIACMVLVGLAILGASLPESDGLVNEAGEVVNTTEEDIAVIIFFTATMLPALAMQFAYYTVLPNRMNGQTLGKRIVNIRIVTTDNSSLTIGKLFVRHIIGYYISGMIFYLGFLWVFWDDDRQAWHDKLVSTVVVEG
ncbi:MAG: RDD family protein [Chloroflexota bacterium]